MPSWLRLHADVRQRLRAGLTRAQAHRELEAAYPAKELARALREYPEPERFARFRTLNGVLFGLLVLAALAKAVTLALLAPTMLALGLPVWLLVLTPLPSALLLAFALYGLRDGMGMSYRAAGFMALWTIAQLFTGSASAPAPYVWIDLVFAGSVATIALYLHRAMLEGPWVHQAPAA